MPHIFGLGENLTNDITTPVIRVGKFLFAFPNATPLLCGVDRRSFHLIVIEDTGDVIGTVSFDGQPEKTAIGGGGRDGPRTGLNFLIRIFSVVRG